MSPVDLFGDDEWGPLQGLLEVNQRAAVVGLHPGGTTDVQKVIMSRRIGIGRTVQEQIGACARTTSHTEEWHTMNVQAQSQTYTDLGFEVNPLSDLMAAEVVGLDLSQPLDEATRAAVYDAFVTYQVLAFRNQHLTKPQQVAFSEQFGPLERHTLSNRGDDDFPMVHVVSNLNAEGKPSGTVGSREWHTDKSFRPAPSLATILHAVDLPPSGGDTCFANMYAAYEALSAAEKAEIDEQRVVHSWELSRSNLGRTMSEEEKRDAPDTSHPLARTHPDTGRRCLFMGTHASYLEGMPIEEGRARIIELEAHATQSRFVYRHQWRQGDMLMWDNRCLLHRVDPNFDAARYARVLNRTCLRGTPTA